jgi:hypothetical protein
MYYADLKICQSSRIHAISELHKFKGSSIAFCEVSV